MKYTSRGNIHTVQQIANEVAAENNGRVELIQVKARLRQKFERDPEMINLDRICSDCVKSWDRANHKALGKGERPFVPGAFITVGRQQRVRMRDATAPDLLAWESVEEEAAKNFNKTMEKRRRYRDSTLGEMSENPDCKTVGDIEQRLHGYVPSEDDIAAARVFGYGDDEDDE